MKRFLKILLLLLLLAQLPFLYALLQSYLLHRYLEAFPREDLRRPTPFEDVRGAIHIHSMAGGHSLGTYPEILEAGREAGCNFLFITEHPHEPFFVPIEDPEILMIYGFEEDREDSARILRSEDWEVAFLTHHDGEIVPPELTGMEVYNIHDNAKAHDGWFQRLNFLYHQPFLSDLFFFHVWELDSKRLALWDRGLRERHLTGIGGNDAHQNVGVILQTADGRLAVRLLVDPYRRSFEFVNTHLLLSTGTALARETVFEALRQGTAYVAFGSIGDPTGFSFHAEEGGRVFPMGSTVNRTARLILQAPTLVRFVLRRDGERIRELEGSYFHVGDLEPGVHRLEVFPLAPPSLLRDRPWILSNPIRVVNN